MSGIQPSLSAQTLFMMFLAMNSFAALINHIDDTDETFGYWEPLHYLLYGTGMQTWEYSPEFAIRTYSFISFFYPFAWAYKYVGLTKPEIFLGVRLILGSLTAYAESRLIASIEKVFGSAYMRMTLIVLLFSPGIFFGATSFLPSAVAMSLTMLFLASWLQGKFVAAIAWACTSVLCTGWPFVGVIYFTFGIHMLFVRYGEKGAAGVVSLAAQGAAILALNAAYACSVDSLMYGKLTSPTWNIIVYNAGGNGDTLYGEAPLKYYLNNLMLTMGASWPTAMTAPWIYLKEYLSQPPVSKPQARRVLGVFATLAISTLLWLGMLFSRPHKEERFLYPAYPLIALMSVSAAVYISDLVGQVVSQIAGERTPLSIVEEFRIVKEIRDSPGKKSSEKLEEMKEKVKGRDSLSYKLKHAVILSFLLGTVTLGFSRTYSNFTNYGGYMQVWREAYKSVPALAKAQGEINFSKSEALQVCTGSEWYYFPSHFFLPDKARLAFVRDGFYGQLPQHYDGSAGILAGTSRAPKQPMNDQNKEEFGRYIAVDECDFVVSTVSATREEDTTPMLRKMTIFRDPSERSKLIDEELDLQYFEVAATRGVLDADKSKVAVLRALSVPYYSWKYNKLKRYQLLTHVRYALGVEGGRPSAFGAEHADL